MAKCIIPPGCLPATYIWALDYGLINETEGSIKTEKGLLLC